MPELSWDATDLNNADSESGVVHESVANTDFNDASILQQGYSAASPFQQSDTLAYYPLHEDSGTTVNDFSGNGNDATNNGATVDQPGILDTTSYSFDGVDDFCEGPAIGYSDPLTLSFWVNTTQGGSSAFNGIVCSDDSSGSAVQTFLNADAGGVLRVEVSDLGSGNTYQADGSTSINDGEWHFCVFRYDSAASEQGEVFIDGSKESLTISNDGTATSSITEEPLIGVERTKGAFFEGKIANVRIFSTELTDTQTQQLYDVAAATSSLITASKTS